MKFRLRDQSVELSLALLFLLGVFGLSYGCTKAYKVHPGAANVTDSQAYDSLLVAKAAIDQAKLELGNGMLAAKYKNNVNLAVDAYNVARAAYVSYHDAAIAGSDTAALLATLQTDLTNLSAAIAQVQKDAGQTP